MHRSALRPGHLRLSRFVITKSRRQFHKLRVEHLEERLNPAVISWDVDADGFWDEASNWSTDTVPGPDDDVVIDRAGGEYVVTIRSGDQSVKSLQSVDSVVLTAGSLSLSSASRFDGPLTLSGGTLSGAGDITIAGSLTWTAGHMIGSG